MQRERDNLIQVLFLFWHLPGRNEVSYEKPAMTASLLADIRM